MPKRVTCLQIYARIEQITSFEAPPEGEEWENASKRFPFLPPLPLVLYGRAFSYLFSRAHCLVISCTRGSDIVMRETWRFLFDAFPLPGQPLDICVLRYAGDVGNYCPVALRDEKWLLPGKPRLSLQVRQRVYMLFDEEKKYKFAADTRRYLPSLDKSNEAQETGTLAVPPPR